MVTINCYYHYYLHHELNLQRPNPGQGEKIKLNFCFHTSFGATKGFMKALKACIKPFEIPQKSVKIKI